MSLFLVLLLFWIVTQTQLVLVLGLLALLFGTILERPVQFFQERHFPRPAAILAVYLIILGSLVLLIVAIAPSIADQASDFSDQLPDQLRDLRSDWRGSDIGLLSGPGVEVLNRSIETLEGDSDPDVSAGTIQQAIPVLTSITGVLVSTVTLLVMTFYYLLEKRLLRGLILDTLTPRFRARVDGLWTEVENKVGGWMRGQLLLCLIIGTIATISYGVIGLNFWPLLGLWAGLTEIVPIIGPWIGGVPAVLVALTMSWELALITVGIIVTMQALENWVLVPRVMKGAVGLTPLTVFAAILAGTQFMGVVGAVLAIPIAATIQVILTDFLERRASRDERMSARSGWRWMLSRSGLRDVDFDEEQERARRAAVRDDEEESYIAQQESESFYMNNDDGDDAVDEAEPADPVAGPDIPEPAGDAPGEPKASDPEPRRKPRPERVEAEVVEPDDEHGPVDTSTWPKDPDDPDSPAFSAWPRTGERAERKPASSTWPPLEQGRPERLRRPRRKDNE